MKIFRGEKIRGACAERIRTLKDCLSAGLPADFVNGGNPYFLASCGLFDGSVQHVANNFTFDGVRNKKHFISFTESEETAVVYARGTTFDDEAWELEQATIRHDYTSSFISGSLEHAVWENSEYFIASLSLERRVTVQEGYSYGYIVEYDTYGRERSKLFALDASKFFEMQLIRLGDRAAEAADLFAAYENAKRDREWLVLGLDLIQGTPNAIPSASGIIKHGDILAIEFAVDQDWWESVNPARFGC